ncbi:MAG: response regulator [Elusimicrobia bacterium]|nr:response regulator [Elusimicrobiota bacterium]
MKGGGPARYAKFFDLSLDLLCIAGFDGSLKELNPAWEETLGYPRQELLGRPYAELVHPEDREAAAAATRRLAGGEASVPFKGRWRCRDGSYRWLLWEARGDPEEKLIYAAGRDITEHQRLDDALREALQRNAASLDVEKAARAEAEEASRARDRFLALVSHELRTPLTAVLGWTWLLRSGELTSGQRDYALKVIARNMEIERQIIEELLDISGLMRRRVVLKKQTVDLAGPVSDAVAHFLSPAQAKNLRLTCPAAAGLWVEGDPLRLCQVFWNIISNAVKFTPAGGKVTVLMRREGGRVVVTVEDTGPGISAEFYPHLFDVFRQQEEAFTREHRGLGLGLTIVKRLLDLHGGTVSVDPPAPGRGARLIVALTLAAPPPGAAVWAAAARGAEPAAEPAQLLKGVRILVVEDDEDTRHMLTAMLVHGGADARGAPSALEGFAAFSQARPDVVISDIAMPGEDGYSFIRRIRALRPQDGGLVPAAALTAYATPDDRARALNAGYQMFLPKPVDPAELFTVVRLLAQGSRPGPGRGL